MRLRRITLSGFKTFAARSEVLFDPGITAIVGTQRERQEQPRRCGALGARRDQRRELRGQRMDEVIYAGGGGRQRMGLAQVSWSSTTRRARCHPRTPRSRSAGGSRVGTVIPNSASTAITLASVTSSVCSAARG